MYVVVCLNEYNVLAPVEEIVYRTDEVSIAKAIVRNFRRSIRRIERRIKNPIPMSCYYDVARFYEEEN